MNGLILLAVVALFAFIFFTVKNNKGGASQPPKDNGNVGSGKNCQGYYNNTSNPIGGVNYVHCNGDVITDATVDGGQSICAQPGTLYGGDSAYLTPIGNC